MLCGQGVHLRDRAEPRRIAASLAQPVKGGTRWSSRAIRRLEEIRELAAARGVEFFFAQFVDLYGRPSAKLVPAANLDDLVADGAGFAGFAAGEIGQLPSDPDIAAIPDLDSLTLVPWQPNLARFACDVTVEGEPWPYCPRTILRRQLARATELGYEFKLGLELEYFLVRRTEDGWIEIADARGHAREALLRHGRPDAAVRLPHDGLEVLQRARLGQLRERPRGRERPVRAELRLRRRARLAATGRSSSATWSTRSPSSTGWSRPSCRSRSRT